MNYLRRFSTLALCLLAIIAISALSYGQTENATITGRVTDSSGAVLPGASVTLQSAERGTSSQTTTNGSGIYIFPNVQPGVYHITVHKDGFRSENYVGLTANVQDHLEQNFRLAVGAASESVTVSADAVNINTSDGSVSTVVDQSYVKNMPLNGRSFQDLILLTPGVVTATPQINPQSGQTGVGQTGEFSVNGQRTESNYYTVDGVSANTGIGASGGVNPLVFSGASGSVAASTSLGTTQALVSVDALQEFRVQSSTYSAEYGRNPGGQFAFDTKSGTNQFHGTAYNYLRNDLFDAPDYFTDYFRLNDPTLRSPALRQNDFGGSIGGPVKIPRLYDGKDKTFFFFSYEGLRLVQPQPPSTIAVPDLCMRGDAASCPAGRIPADAALQPVLKAFPLPSPSGNDDAVNGVGQFIGGWSNHSSLDSTNIRLDHIARGKHRLFFRFSNTSSDSTALQGTGGSGLAPGEQAILTYTTRSYTAGASSPLSNQLSNEFRINYTSNSQRSEDTLQPFAGSVPADFGQLTGLGTSSQVNPFFFLGSAFLSIDQTRDRTAQRQWNLVDTASYSVGRHQLKFGADYRRLTPFSVPHSAQIFYAFFDEPSVEANSGLYLLSAFGPGHPLFQNFSLFAQDEWKVSSRLALSLGLRWEVNPAPGATEGTHPYTVQGTNPDDFTLAPQGTQLWQTTWFNFAPRLGAAYQLHGTQGWETVLRGGGGVFFDTGQQLGALSFTGPGFSTFGGIVSSPFPGTPLTVPQIVNPPTGPFSAVYGFSPHLQLPYTLQWNATVEQALGRSQAITISYVGAHASRLLQQNQFTSTTNPVSNTFVIVQNGLRSDYNALQLQFRRRLTKGLTGLASYTWSHCLDFGSNNFANGFERGNCNFDVQHSLSAALSYDLPNVGHNRFATAVLHHWGIDNRFTARTGFPVDLTGNSTFDPATARRISNGMNFTGEPIFLYQAQCDATYAADFGATLPCPGGRAINPDAFTPVASGNGNVPRNFVRGFGAWQMDLGIRREFPIYERLKIQFRAEAFNLFNHPNLGFIDGFCGSAGNSGSALGCSNSTFGQAKFTLANSLGVLSPLYQMGGSRSMQFALKVVF